MPKAPSKAKRDHRQLQQIIAGLGEGIVLIDRDMTILWANEAALAMHAATKLSELGKTFDDYRDRFRLRFRNNHPLEVGAHPVECVANGEVADSITVEVALSDNADPEWVHSVRCVALLDADDEPDCLAMIIEDETKRFEAEERFESAFNANPAPAIICRLEDLRYIKVNMGFMEMTGHAREALIGRSAYEVDVLAEAERRDLALERLKEGRTIPQMEACLTTADGARKFVIVAGEPIQIKDEECMLFTFADLDPRKKAETALRQSEERFAKSFRLSPVATAICTRDGLKVVEANEAYARLSGAADEEILGRSPFEGVLTAERASLRRLETLLDKEGRVLAFDMELATADGGRIDCVVSAETVQINDEPCVLCVLQDITERKRSESELITAIEAVMADTSWFSRSVVEKLANLKQTADMPVAGPGLEDLTDRERDILGLICEGQSDEGMSDVLHLSRNTIRNHVASLYRKIGVNRRPAAIVWARERGITGRAGSTRKPAKK